MKKLFIISLITTNLSCQNGNKIIKQQTIAQDHTTKENVLEQNQEVSSDESFLITIDGETYDCDKGSTLELSVCSRYIADSLRVELEELYQIILTETNSTIKEYENYLRTINDSESIKSVQDELVYNKQISKNLIKSHNSFLLFLQCDLDLINATIDGNGRVLSQNLAEVKHLEKRIADLKSLFWSE